MAINVPGPQAAWYLAGSKIAEWVCAISLAGNLGLGVVTTSYNQQIFISLVGETRLVPNVERLKGFVQEAFEKLSQRVSQGQEACDELRHRTSQIAQASKGLGDPTQPCQEIGHYLAAIDLVEHLGPALHVIFPSNINNTRRTMSRGEPAQII